MSSIISFVSEVEAAVSGGDAARRVDTLRKVTDLFVAQSSRLNEAHVDVFDEVIMRLARDIEFKARVDLSDTLADVANAPRQVVRDLALDGDINVARPILERSSRLSEDDLVEIAERQGQDHLFAISRRTVLSEKVTDVLVVRGDESVVRSVAGNEGARFSDQGFGRLVEKAKQDPQLQETLKARGDVPARQMETLVAIARERVQATLRKEMGDKADAAIEATLGKITETMTGDKKPALFESYDEAMERIGKKARSGELTEADVLRYLKENKVPDALATLAHLSGMPVEMVANAYQGSNWDPLLMLVRSLRFSWNTFKLLLTIKAGRVPPPDVLKASFESFQQLSVATAQRVVRFTIAREKAGQTEAA